MSQSVPEQSGQSDTPVSHVGVLGGELFFLVSCSTLQCCECQAVFCAVGEWRLFILNSRFWEIKRQVYFDSSVVCL